jgi:hypothetical protein
LSKLQLSSKLAHGSVGCCAVVGVFGCELAEALPDGCDFSLAGLSAHKVPGAKSSAKHKHRYKNRGPLVSLHIM